MAEQTTKALLEYFVDSINEAKKTNETNKFVLSWAMGRPQFERKAYDGRFAIRNRCTKREMEIFLRGYLRGAID